MYEKIYLARAGAERPQAVTITVDMHIPGAAGAGDLLTPHRAALRRAVRRAGTSCFTQHATLALLMAGTTVVLLVLLY